ncbi:unnamed protein product [Cylindrotheca closterium]|uniref:Uncharacterized protein n=1 Tax=Cylindrotheca closterium TaxID=2856 RepID=A0AAD2FWU1_9STRA|nr:unnamed protein product [Cylindrotheca closterium]
MARSPQKRTCRLLLSRKCVYLLSALYGISLLVSFLIHHSLNSFTLDVFFDTYRDNASSSFDPYAETLALLSPPGMIGGYRNQAIRLVSLVRYAQRYNITQILLPTLLFSTTFHGQSNKLFMPIPMDEVFDIDHWNSFGSKIPILVPYVENSDCWTNHSSDAPLSEQMINSLASEYEVSVRKADDNKFASPMAGMLQERSSFLSRVLDINRALVNGDLRLAKPRKLDLTPLVYNCSRPHVYGGGRGAGRLWNDYTHMAKYNPLSDNNTEQAIQNSELIKLVSHQALRPSPKWKSIANQCVRYFQGGSSDRIAPYVALHARVEVTMMNHRCGKSMEKNLTQIFSMVDSTAAEYNKKHENKIRGIFVAVSRDGMLEHTTNSETSQMAKENWETLAHRSIPIQTEDDFSTQIPYFECGELWMDHWYGSQNEVSKDYYGSLVPSVMNFHLATEATFFVGVMGSSWSIDVWTTRYYQGKGGMNFQYTPTGIKPVGIDGRPPSHDNC